MKKKPKKQKKQTVKRACDNENCDTVTSKGYETGPWNAKVFLCDTCFEDDIRLSTTPRKPKVISHGYKRMQK